jgi:ABC-type transport system involved in multi-copper enzyme maturation permease subunit
LPSHSTAKTHNIAGLVLMQEIRNLLLSPALWSMLIIISLLVGYSFIQAVELFSKASRTAATFPELASGMTTLDGIFVPTFGAYYLTQTLLLPFIAIRLIGLDKKNGALKLLLQLPLSPLSLCSLKICAMFIVWLASLLPAFLTFLIWHNLGGHIHWPEIILLLIGHGLYALTVITIGMFAATVSDALPTAAIFCLAITLGSWVLEFASAGQTGFVALLGNLSMTGMLRQFENGLLSTTYAASFVSIAGLFFLLTAIWLHPGRQPAAKIVKSSICLLVLFFTVYGAILVPGYFDVTENHKHSLNPSDTRALQQLSKPLTITIHLDPQDSRLLDLEQDLLGKLRRTVPQLTVKYFQTGSTGVFSNGSDDYGLIEYSCNGRHEQSYSNSQEEILPIIYNLAGIHVTPDAVPAFHGHPLVADAAGSRYWFYIILPLFFFIAGIYARIGKW